MQSSDYVPGVSGWKMENGRLEANSAKASVGDSPTQPRMIEITAGDWAEFELPTNGLERHAFIGAELMKIPAEWRDSAEFSTCDESYEPCHAEIHTVLTYKRLETAEEVSDRIAKAAGPGISVVIDRGNMIVMHDGVVRCRTGDLTLPFVVEGGQVFISEALVSSGRIVDPGLPNDGSVKINGDFDGRYFKCAATGTGAAAQVESVKPEPVKSVVEKAIESGDAQAILAAIRGTISETKLSGALGERLSPKGYLTTDENGLYSDGICILRFKKT